MSTVKLITGRIVENVRLTNIEHVGDEGSRTAIAHIDGKTYPVYNSIIDGWNSLWTEQITYETFKMLEGNAGFAEEKALCLWLKQLAIEKSNALRAAEEKNQAYARTYSAAGTPLSTVPFEKKEG